MDYRTLEITLGSAKGLKQVNVFSKMAVYAVVSVSSDRRSSHRTPSDPHGGRNPIWHSTLRLAVPAEGALSGSHSLHILLRTERACPLGDRDVGEVRVPLADLFNSEGNEGRRSVRHISYQVCPIGSGRPKGVLNFSYKLGERIPAPDPDPITDFAYPSAVDAHGARPCYRDSRRARDGDAPHLVDPYSPPL
ncbi:protein SRC2-like [Zingiber officinale]|uniref:C2 domain-containing protein n=1 Tax=Zingiber officinale TaxID=94328 RepID=A0A8J5FG96_ZINOF|nr:protein SRC2-like [Zingiber officinale]KAG6487764.1 hypothetical protein ZIOFF_056366 [Zingiber officinale]